MLLYALSCFSEAFVIFLRIIDLISRSKRSDAESSSLLYFYIIYCARSAETEDQVDIARALTLETYTPLVSQIPIGVPYHLGRQFHARTQQVLLSGELQESLQETAFWTASACWIVSESFQSSIGFENLRPESAWTRFRECFDTRVLLLDALEKMAAFLKEHSNEIEKLGSSSCNGTAQAVACMLLETSFREGLTEPNPSIWSRCDCSQHSLGSFNLGLRTQVLATMPFAVMSWVHGGISCQHCWNSDSSHMVSNLSLLNAIEHLLEAEAMSEEYKSFIDIYLRCLTPCRSGRNPITKMISDERFSAMAGVVSGALSLHETHHAEFLCPELLPTKKPNPTNVALNPDNATSDASVSGQEFADHTSSHHTIPTLARSLLSRRSSMSSDFRSFQAIATRSKRSNSSLSVDLPDHMSWEFSTVTGLSSRRSVRDEPIDDSATS